MATKTVRLTKPWQFHLKGALLTLEPNIADLMIQSGRAELVEPKAEVKIEQKPQPQHRRPR